MRQWQICTSLHAVRSSQYLLRNKQKTSVASLMAHSKVGTTVIETQGSFVFVLASGRLLILECECMGGRFGRTLRQSSSCRGYFACWKSSSALSAHWTERL